MRGAGALRHLVAFDAPVRVPDGSGGFDRTWSDGAPMKAELRYDRGAEASQAGRLTGTAVFKVRVRSSAAARAVTADHRMRDLRSSAAYQVREVDAETDRQWVWIGVEGGVAV